MIGSVLRRLGWSLLIVWFVVTITFLMVVAIPSDPAKTMLGPRADAAALARVTEHYCFGESVPVQYGCWLDHLVHGDLSAYNMLWHAGRARMIDVPQAVELHGRPDGFAYLARDVANLERYFARYGLSAGDFAVRTWRRYERGQLGR